MKFMTKVLLAVSLSGFALGCTGVLWGFGTPVGAISFGLFLISFILEKETTQYDQEQRARLAAALKEQPAAPARPAPKQTPSAKHAPALA